MVYTLPAVIDQCDHGIPEPSCANHTIQLIVVRAWSLPTPLPLFGLQLPETHTVWRNLVIPVLDAGTIPESLCLQPLRQPYNIKIPAHLSITGIEDTGGTEHARHTHCRRQTVRHHSTGPSGRWVNIVSVCDAHPTNNTTATNPSVLISRPQIKNQIS